MAVDEIIVGGKSLGMRRAVINPNFGSKNVLTSNAWEYIELWLRRNAAKTDAPFFWQQAQAFYHSSVGLPVTASPLSLYYCFLNATKALLSAKSVNFASHHGLSGAGNAGKSSLANEIVKLKGGGVHFALRQYLREDVSLKSYSLKDILYNLAFVHRAYCLSYSEGELFIPVDNCRYVCGKGVTEAWVTGDADDCFNDKRVLATLPDTFERDVGFPEKLVIRKRQRFKWRKGQQQKASNERRLANYHGKLRQDITYIAGVGQWYIKRRLASATIIDRHTTTLIFAAMHRLSELCRYDPLRLSRLMDSQRNWLLSEFIRMSAVQFIDEIACEITGQEINVPGIHGGSFLSA